MRARQQISSRSGVLFTVLVGLLLAGVTLDGIRQSHVKAIRNPNDFVTLYAGSICMTHACNPYDVPDLDAVLVSRRGTEVRQAWEDQLPIYPPTTLVLLLPFSLLSYKSATIVWFVLSLGIYVFGLLWACFRSSLLQGTSLIARCGFALLALHFPKMLQCLGFGNPSVMVTGLLLFAVFDASANRRTLHVAAALLACFLKPPMAIPVGVVMLLRQFRTTREAWRIVAVCTAIFVAIALCSLIPEGMRHWQHDLAANIALGQQGGMNPSNRVSPSNVLLNVANIPGYFTTNRVAIQAVALAVVLPLAIVFTVALYRVCRRRQWSDRTYLTAVAAAAALTLLPVYHRFCDIGVLLLVAPWLMREFSERAAWQAWATLPMLGALYFSWERRIHLDKIHGSAGLVEFLYYRGDAVLVLLLTCVLISAMYRREPLRSAAA